MHIINADNYQEAQDAIRDILMTYVDLADSTEGFGHNADVYIRFDPLKYVDAEVEDARTHYVDLELLRSGSAVALLCALYDMWIEEHALDGLPLTVRIQAAILQGRLSRYPDIESVITQVIRRNCGPIEDFWIETAVAPIYRKYVLGFFARLVTRDRSAR